MTWESFLMGVATGGFGTTWALSLARLVALGRQQTKAKP